MSKLYDAITKIEAAHDKKESVPEFSGKKKTAISNHWFNFNCDCGSWNNSIYNYRQDISC